MSSLPVMTPTPPAGSPPASPAPPSPRWRLAARFGYVVKGTVYVLVGLLAGRAALAGQRAPGPRALLWRIFEQPAGTALLAVVALGLAAYAVWRTVQAVADTERWGRGWRGSFIRAGYFGSGLVHAGLVVAAVRILAGAVERRARPGDAYVRAWTAVLMSRPSGRWLVAAAGVGVIGFALAQWVKAWTGKLTDEGDLSALGPRGRRWATRFGRAGAAARGVVFLIVGGWLLVAARSAEAGDARGLGGALDTLARQPHGPWLIAAVAAGLLAYGLYQFTLAGYRPPPHRSPRTNERTAE